MPVFWHTLTRLSIGSLVSYFFEKNLFHIFRQYSALKVYHELVQDAPPIPCIRSSIPFLCDVYHGQIKQFEQGIICRENRSCFSDFPELPVKVLNGIRSINDFAYFSRIFEIGAYLRPVVSPRSDR